MANNIIINNGIVYWIKINFNTILDTKKVYAIGSDTDNMDTRPSNMKQAIEVINKKFNLKTFDDIMKKTTLY